jgi:hypothetical protein
MTEAPYSLEFAPKDKGTYTITAIATDAEGKENLSAKKTLKVNGKRTPYTNKPITIPGVIQAENFDKGGEGLTFHDSDSNREGDKNYRSDGEGVDFVVGNGGTAIGYTAANEWLEYSINVIEAGKYSYDATVSSGTTGSGFSIGLVKNGSVTTLARVSVPQTGSSNWDTYKVVSGDLSRNLEEGEQILRITITGAQCNIDKIELKCTISAGIESVTTARRVNSNEMYNLAGQKVGANYKGIVIKNGKKFVMK